MLRIIVAVAERIVNGIVISAAELREVARIHVRGPGESVRKCLKTIHFFFEIFVQNYSKKKLNKKFFWYLMYSELAWESESMCASERIKIWSVVDLLCK